VRTDTLAARDVSKPLVHLVVAVVVQAVADFDGSGMNERIQRGAVCFVRGPVVIIVLIHAVLQAICVLVRKALVHGGIAVVVRTVTYLLGSGIDKPVCRCAVEVIRHAVTILVLLTRITCAVVVQVRLPPVGHEGAVVGSVLGSVPVEVVVTDITQPVTVQVRLLSVLEPEAVVHRVGN